MIARVLRGLEALRRNWLLHHLAEPHFELAEFGRRFIPQSVDGTASLPALLALSRGVADAVSYRKNSTSVTTTALEAFRSGAGV